MRIKCARFRVRTKIFCKKKKQLWKGSSGNEGKRSIKLMFNGINVLIKISIELLTNVSLFNNLDIGTSL
jgi:hypothetical protein